ncbi:MAG: TlyA family RNA methyltransferase [Kiritimatiellae bacterium]|nr:TlyA family RNA methyltransferase [Kiritimatiellia bacterium]
MKKERLDQLLLARGLAPSRENAQRLIRAGKVQVGGRPATKPGHTFAPDVRIDVTAPDRFVGRGGEKLQAAFEAFGIDVRGLACLDVGASTGGFTDCLLQNGAARVYAVDVGRGQLHWRLRNDPRVAVMEGVNARYLSPDRFRQTPAFAAIDVSFISLTKILPPVTHLLPERAGIVTLIKPQFEAGRHEVGKGGVVRDPGVRAAVVDRIRAFGADELGLAWLGVLESPLKGPAGNVEFLAYWRKRGE